MGPQGLTGADGAVGPMGPQGLTGADGAVGPMGPQGLTGATGETGATGAQGPAGANGAVGPAGPQGVPGVAGPAGTAGEAGPIGPQGPAGGVKADGPCYLDDTNRYQDCGNGTVTDTATGLIWLKNADCFGEQTWSLANRTAAALADGACDLSDGSAAGDWRLPSPDEWYKTVAAASSKGCSYPVLTDTEGANCAADSTTLFTGVRSAGQSAYWSSATLGDTPDSAYAMGLDIGGYFDMPTKTTPRGVWPVRGTSGSGIVSL